MAIDLTSPIPNCMRKQSLATGQMSMHHLPTFHSTVLMTQSHLEFVQNLRVTPTSLVHQARLHSYSPAVSSTPNITNKANSIQTQLQSYHHTHGLRCSEISQGLNVCLGTIITPLCRNRPHSAIGSSPWSLLSISEYLTVLHAVYLDAYALAVIHEQIVISIFPLPYFLGLITASTVAQVAQSTAHKSVTMAWTLHTRQPVFAARTQGQRHCRRNLKTLSVVFTRHMIRCK